MTHLADLKEWRLTHSRSSFLPFSLLLSVYIFKRARPRRSDNKHIAYEQRHGKQRRLISDWLIMCNNSQKQHTIYSCVVIQEIKSLCSLRRRERKGMHTANWNERTCTYTYIYVSLAVCFSSFLSCNYTAHPKATWFAFAQDATFRDRRENPRKKKQRMCSVALSLVYI